MAKLIDTMPSPRAPQYPWDVYLDGQARTLVQGEDFTVPAATMRMNAVSTARRRGVQIISVVKGNTLYLQAVKPKAAKLPKALKGLKGKKAKPSAK